MHGAELLEELTAQFGAAPKPATLLKMSPGTRRRYAKEVNALEDLDWDTARPEDMDAFYEPNTFLSIAGYKYLMPKVFAFCMRWPGVEGDLLEVMRVSPFVLDSDAFIASFDGNERRLLWLFLEAMHRFAGDDVFEDFGEKASALRTKLMR